MKNSDAVMTHRIFDEAYTAAHQAAMPGCVRLMLMRAEAHALGVETPDFEHDPEYNTLHVYAIMERRRAVVCAG